MAGAAYPVPIRCCHTTGGPVEGHVVGRPRSIDLPLRCGPKNPGQSVPALAFCATDWAVVSAASVCITTDSDATQISAAGDIRPCICNLTNIVVPTVASWRYFGKNSYFASARSHVLKWPNAASYPVSAAIMAE